MIKFLITSGCSFSEIPSVDESWPLPLSKALNVEVDFQGRGACGNGIISRTIIHSVNNALNTYKPEEILVGVMWSGLDRFEFYRKDKSDIDYHKLPGGPRYCNPQYIAGEWSSDPAKRNYIVVNTHWQDSFTKNFYKNIYSDEYGALIGLEHILRTQWFLKLHKIKYFMTAYSWDALPKLPVTEYDDIKNLLDQIDWNEWLDIKNMDEWARNTKLPYVTFNNGVEPRFPHPSPEMHKKFVDEHIIPHLKKKNLI